MAEYTQETIEQLIDGRLPWSELRHMMSSFKDDGRFGVYVAALQQRVPWEDRIVLPLSDNLFIVQSADGELVTS